MAPATSTDEEEPTATLETSQEPAATKESEPLPEHQPADVYQHLDKALEVAAGGRGVGRMSWEVFGFRGSCGGHG